MTRPIDIPHQIIEQGGKPAFAVLPYEDFVKLAAQCADESDVTIPHEVVKANVRGDTMVKAWREHLGLTQDELAAKAGISQPAVAKLEKPDSRPRRATLKKLAAAMGIEVEQLEE
jgi:DNA-binding XRE family transcriptional regulator